MKQIARAELGGSGIDRGQPISFTFNQYRLEGFQGDTVASALLANGVRLVGRSFKYHRPRGVFGIGSEEPSALLHIGEGARRTPNVRATVQELYQDLTASSQNHWPSLNYDLGAAVGVAGALFPAGFYYKTFIASPKRWLWYEKHIRRMAGLGEAPAEADPDYYAHRHAHCDVLIAGGGPAGLSATLAAGRAGARIILVDENPALGGNLLLAPQRVDDQPGEAWAAAAAAELEALPNVRVLSRTTLAGVYEHDYFTLVERITDHLSEPELHVPRQRFWTVRARQAVFAAGAIERPIAFANNDRPGVMLLSAVRGYLARYGVLAGKTAVLFTNNDSAYATARELQAAGMRIEAIADCRPSMSDAEAQAASDGFTVLSGHAVAAARGMRGVRAAELAPIDAAGRTKGVAKVVACDLIGVSGGWNPAVHLHAQSRGKLSFVEETSILVPDPATSPYRSAGAANGAFSLAACLAEGAAAGAEAARVVGFEAEIPDTLNAEGDTVGSVPPLWAIQARKGAKLFVDIQNDVTTKDIGLAHRENYQSVEHLKRYTTLGMGTDQGKTSNVAGLALMAQKRGEPIPQVGTTTFRPPLYALHLQRDGGGPSWRDRPPGPPYCCARLACCQWRRLDRCVRLGPAHVL